MSAELVRFEAPQASRRTVLTWVVAPVVIALVLVVVLAATGAGPWWVAVLVVVLVAGVTVGVATTSTWIDTDHGTVVRRRLGGLSTGRRAWSDGPGPVLVDTRAGTLALRVGARRPLHLPVLTLTDYVEKSLDAQTLTFLADQVAQWASTDTATRTAELLRQQATYVASGGPAASSPLASMVTRGITRAAKGGGAAGSGGSLLG